jgi:dipeptidyl aminopeptidase/acylaminoacyl peptidase
LRGATALVAIALAALYSPAAAEKQRQDTDPVPVTATNRDLAEQWRPDSLYDLMYSTNLLPNWINDGDQFWYRYLTAEGRHYWLVEPASRSRTALFDRRQLAAELARLTGETPDETNLDLVDLAFEAEGTRFFSFDFGESRYRFDRQDDSLSQIESSTVADSLPAWANISPDGALGIYARGRNLYLRRFAEPEDKGIQLTFDGVAGLSWGPEWTLVDDGDQEPRPIEGHWSPDSRRFCILRADLREVGDLWLIDHLAEPRPTLTTYKCPMPGEKVPQWELWTFDASTMVTAKMDIERWPDQTMGTLFHAPVWWSPDAEKLYFVRRSRDYKRVDLCAADPVTGVVRVVIEERIDGMVYFQPLIQLPQTNELLWWSMRDGWGHYYLYGDDGTLKNQVTGGDFNVAEVTALDTDLRILYFQGNGREEGRNPYYQHLYRIKLDGSGLQLLTPAEAAHRCTMSPSHRFFLDDYSRQDQPNRINLHDSRGKLLLELETADATNLLAAGWQAPELFKAMAADGKTEMWGVMYKPFDFDPGKKYPIATRVYPGRQDEGIPRIFWPPNAETYLANLGCIVVRFGNRGGTPERGLAYREYGREQFRDYGLADKKAVIEELAARHRWIDLDRVGIYGGSSGGFMTVSAMLVHPDFFKVGVAMTAPNDPGIYYNIWAERYYGVERVEDEDGTLGWQSEPEGNIEIADQLQGKLLMIYGAQDDVVHPAHLYRQANAFIAADKRFDMFIIPGVDHSLGAWRYLYGLVWDYFAEHLIEGASE